MKKKTNMKKVLITTALVTASMLAIGGTSSQAALQANAATHKTGKTYTGQTLIKSIREMETSGQTMGLNETVNATSLLASTTNNGIDVHMMKSTEYGAMAILSASGFGNPNKLQDSATKIKSTTGNVTGVYLTGSRYEWVAGICDTTNTVGSINARYYDKYTINDQTSAKIGDALGKTEYATNPGCSGWHGGSASWIYNTSYGFCRGSSGMFSFNCSGWTGSYCGRGVAVVGTGL